MTAFTLSLLWAGLVNGAEKNDKGGPDNAASSVVATVNPTGARMDAMVLARTIDQLVAQRLKEDGIAASLRCSDEEFLRRAFLDITGKIPSLPQALTFLDSKDPAKRPKMIDELLASPDYGKHQADIWQALLLPRNSDNRRLQPEPMVSWLEQNFNANKPWDKMVSDLLTATGAQDKNGAVTYFIANASVDKITDNVSRLFLGVQLQCAQCHNHPFVNWNQTEYWHMAAFFMKVQATAANKAAKQGSAPEVTEAAMPRRGKNALPEAAKILPPKFLQGEKPTVTSSEPYRPVFAKWLTSADNRFFSKAMVNRTWAQLFGRGLVHTVDDMHDGNLASHPELLMELTRQFSGNEFDVKYLIRALCNSEVYQRTSKPYGNNTDAGPEVFSRMAVKVLSPEQLYDSLGQVFGPGGKGEARRDMGGKRGPANTPRGAFVAFFGIEEANPLEYQAGIPQTLRLMNNPQVNQAAQNHPLVRSSDEPAAAIEKIYLATLARRPAKAEQERLLAYVEQHKSERKAAYGDILWAVLNSSEFTLNR